MKRIRQLSCLCWAEMDGAGIIREFGFFKYEINFISFNNNQFKETPMTSRLNWTNEEENLIKILKEDDNVTSWKKIAQVLNEKFADTTRTGKQCRDRYINYVRFSSDSPKLVGWTQEDDRLLFEKFQEHGTKWVMISSEMLGRSENNLKNRFYGAMRKIMRKIAKVEKDMKPKPKKTIKEKQLIKIFQDCRRLETCEELTNNSTNELYEKLLELAISQEDLINSSDVRKVIDMINLFNSTSKSTQTQKKSVSTEDVEKYSFLEQIQSEIEIGHPPKPEHPEEMEQENNNNFLTHRSNSLLKDSLRVDFEDLRDYEKDLDFYFHREVSDLFQFNTDSYFF